MPNPTPKLNDTARHIIHDGYRIPWTMVGYSKRECINEVTRLLAMGYPEKHSQILWLKQRILYFKTLKLIEA